MTAVRYLLDEQLPESLHHALSRIEPAIDVLHVGRGRALPKGTKDPELLAFAEREKLTLLTIDKKTMPGHIADHQTAGGHTYGVYQIRRASSLKNLTEDLYLIWAVEQAEDLLDRIGWLPWER